jgi:hypothetical protein
MMHTDMNNIALKFVSGAVFTVLNLQYYNWRWLKPWELIEVEISRGRLVFEVCKLETGEDRLIAVVRPVKQEVGI